MLLAVCCAIAAGIVNGVMVGLLRLNAIVATIGMDALLYGAVFAVSGGIPRTTTPLLSGIAGGDTWGVGNSVYFAVAILAIVTFVLKKTLVGRRFEAIGANPLAARAVGLHVRRLQIMAYVYAQLLYCTAGVLLAGITNQPTAFQADFAPAPFGRRRGSRRNLADRRPRLSDFDGARGILPEPTEPIRAGDRRALLGSDHYSSSRAWIWHRRLFVPVSQTGLETRQTRRKAMKFTSAKGGAALAATTIILCLGGSAAYADTPS